MRSLVTTHFRRWSALLTGMIVMLVVTVLMSTFIEKMIRFGKSSQGIVQSTQAYYKATSIVETTLMNTDELRKQPWNIGLKPANIVNWSGSELAVMTGAKIVPAPGYGNSPFNDNYNLIGLSDPAQIVIPEWVSWWDVNFEFRVPNMAKDVNYSYSWVDTTSWNSWAILWTLASTGGTLYASGETSNSMFMFGDINHSNKKIFGMSGFYIDSNGNDTSTTFQEFYNDSTNGLGSSWDKCANFQCTLKLSLLREIPLADWRTLPFLEYKIDFSLNGGGNPSIPNQYMVLDAKGYVWGYLRTRRVAIPQITTNTALDFAVLQ